MELKEFVKQTLLDIFTAVQEAGTELRKDPNQKGAIVPMWGGEEHASNHEQAIKFNVAVTVSESASGQARGGIKVMGLDFGARAKSQDKLQEASRVSFTVPVALPATTVTGTPPRPPRKRK